MSYLRELAVQITFDTDTKGLDEAEKAVEDLQKKIKETLVSIEKWALAAGAAIAYGIGRAFEHAIDQALELQRAVATTGTNYEWFQGMAYAAGQAGVDVHKLTNGLSFLQKNAVSAATKGTGQAADAFRRLGISIKDSNGQVKGAQVLVGEIADKMKTLGASERDAVALSLFGRSAKAIVPLLAQGSAALAKYQKHLEDIGGVISEQDNKSLVRTGLNFKDIGISFNAMFSKLGTAFEPAITRIAKSLEHLFKTIGNSPAVWAAVGTAADAVAWVFDKIDKLLTSQDPDWVTLRESLEKAAVSVGLVAAAFGIWTIATSPLTKALFALTGELLIIGLAGLALYAIIDDLWMTFSDPKAVTATRAVLDTIKGLWTDFKEWLFGLIDNLTAWWFKKLNAMLDGVKNVASSVGNALGITSPPIVATNSTEPVVTPKNNGFALPTQASATGGITNSSATTNTSASTVNNNNSNIVVNVDGSNSNNPKETGKKIGEALDQHFDEARRRVR